MKLKTKKIAKLTSIIVGIIIVLIHIISMLTLDKQIEYKEITFQSPKISAEMDGYRIAFICDTHTTNAQELEDVVTKLNDLEIDLLLLGGDYTTRVAKTDFTMEILSQIETVDGIYGIEGNHDKYVVLFEAMEKYSIQPLSNSGVYIRDNLYIAGVEDLWNRKPDIQMAVGEADTSDFVILLAHNPDVTMLQNTEKIDLILSGHTHGGQVTLFGIWAPALELRGFVTDFRQRFKSGWAKSRDGVSVYISNGTGKASYSKAPRIFARPQVIIVNLISE